MEPSPKTPEVRPLKLGESRDVLEVVAPHVQLTAKNFAASLRRALSFLSRQRAQLLTGTPFRCGASSLEGNDADSEDDEGEQNDAHGEPGPSVGLVVSSDNGDWASIHFDDAAILALLDGLFTASTPKVEEEDDEYEDDEEDEESAGLGEELTLAQRALMIYIMKDLSQVLCESIAQSLDLRLDKSEHRVLPAGQAYELPDDAVGVDIQITEVPQPWRFRFYMGHRGLSRSLAQKEYSALGARHTLAECVSPVPFKVVAELGRLKLKLSEVLLLRPGTVLRLSSAVSDPIRVRVEGVVKFAATPVISRGQVAVKIEERQFE